MPWHASHEGLPTRKLRQKRHGRGHPWRTGETMQICQRIKRIQRMRSSQIRLICLICWEFTSEFKTATMVRQAHHA